MKCGILHLKVKPDKLSDFKNYFENELLDKLCDEPGFANAIFLSPKDTSRCLSIGFWDSEEHARNFRNSKTYSDFISSVKDYVTGEPERILYDVTGDVSKFSVKKKAA